MKPVNPSSLRNQGPIFEILKRYLTAKGKLLEIGCGTGQHAVFMGEKLHHIEWQASDCEGATDGANMWISENGILPPAIELDISLNNWQKAILSPINYIYSANVIHFVPDATVKTFFNGVDEILLNDGTLILYGPYNDDGFTSEGNAGLDAWLKADVHPLAGIKELSYITSLANEVGLRLVANHVMPANNHLLVFKKASISLNIN
ncbi:MAG: cyclopropane fatty-acyl-phospholipid synthase-like methyltransferase [Crocinitomicaceae bacterium]|jgi:cyclopropane fatty-acyl-phospholipid synthase-like methyltransferase